MKKLFLLFCVIPVLSADFDTTTIEKLEIIQVYDFVCKKDTIVSTTHHKSGDKWYINGLDNDYESDRKPIVLERTTP